jgi:hypothetical protein
MPFKPALTLPERHPDVQIFFHGLLMLCPDNAGSQCTIGVHRLSIDHKLSVEVREKSPQVPDAPLLRLAGPLDSQGLSIAVEPQTGNGVSRFVPTPDPFVRTDPANDPRDFRWSIDLEKLDPGQPAMILNQSAISPGITIRDGIFVTSQLTDPAKMSVRLSTIGIAPVDLHKVARVIGAHIYLENAQQLVLKWFADGELKTLKLPKSDAGARTYFIYVENSPSLMPIGKPDHSEFAEYFKVVTNAVKNFELDFDPKGPNFHGTDAAPCMSVGVRSGGGGGS